MLRTLNLGILAHVDAGKTSLTEHLLYLAGVIPALGSVDAGSTQTDSLELERQRGITIKSAVVSFVVDDVTVNLIDTPGHPDFIAEVERVLSVLDGAVLVVSAVEGVQSQTRVLMRALQRLNVPTLIFINKLDRRGADDQRVLRQIAARLSPNVVALGTARDLGTRAATFTPYDPADTAFSERIVELLADSDEELLHEYVNNPNGLSDERVRATLAAAARSGRLHPVFCGSALSGAGVPELLAGLSDLLPALERDAGGPPHARVFKIERSPAGEKIAYVRMFSGALRPRDRVRFAEDKEGKITALQVFEQGGAVQRPQLEAGRIGKLWGLGEVRIGDVIGSVAAGGAPARQFAPPTLETVIAAKRPQEGGTLFLALSQLAEQDPLINLHKDDLRGEISVSLYGEVQKEVLEATLAQEYGVEVEFSRTTTIHIERPIGSGAAVEFIAKDANPFLATVGLRLEPGPEESGVHYRIEQELLGTLPFAFYTAIEEAVHETLRQGLSGWQVTDCIVTLTHTGYWARQSSAHGTFDKSMSSTAGDFRNLTPLLLMDALRQAGTNVYEPLQRFHLEAPADTFNAVLSALARCGAVPDAPQIEGTLCIVEGEIPAAQVHELQQQLPRLTRGEGVLEDTFERYALVHGSVPVRPRSDNNPLNRKEYLLNLSRRV